MEDEVMGLTELKVPGIHSRFIVLTEQPSAGGSTHVA